MSEIQVLERDAAATEQPRKVSLVDCDIHPGFTGRTSLFDYLPAKWRSYVERHGSRMVGWASHVGWGGGAREDYVAEEGESGLDLLRRQLLDLYKIEYGVLNLGNFLDRRTPELAIAGARAMNEWTVAEWLADEPRLLGSISVPWEHPEAAVREIERCAADRRWAQVQMPAEALEPLGSPKYWPIYEAATAHGFPVGMHIGGYDPHLGTGWPTYTFEQHMGLAHACRRQLLSIVCEGVFDAVPDVRVVMIEGGVTWAASLRWALDDAYELLADEVRLERKPSEYLDEHVWYTTQPIEEPDDPSHWMIAIEHGRLASRMLFSSDYPHWDFDSPTQALPPSMPKPLRQQILAGNACELYGLPR